MIRLIAACAFAVAMVFAFGAHPTAAATQARYGSHVEMMTNWPTDDGPRYMFGAAKPGVDVWEGPGLRYIPIELERWDYSTGSWEQRSVHKTDRYGWTYWTLYEDMRYRVHVPENELHTESYTEAFIAE